MSHPSQTVSLQSTARAQAALLIGLLRAALRDAPVLTRALLRSLMLTYLVPAETLARRILILVAATLPRAAQRVTGRTLPPALKVSSTQQKPRAPVFRLTEPVRAPRRALAAKQIRSRTESTPDAAFADERFLLSILRRIDAATIALRDPEKAARRLRRYLTRPAARAPLAFGQPPGLAHAPDESVRAVLVTTDTEAEATWARLRDTS